MIRFIQERRKSDGFDISDRIHVKWNINEDVSEAVAQSSAHISDEVLALSFERDTTLAVGDNELGIEVKLARA